MMVTIKNSLKIVVLTLFPFLSSGQTDMYGWDEGMTFYTGKFDTTNFSLEEIDKIYNYLHSPSSEMFTVGNVWKVEQMDTATTTSIDTYYKRSLHVLETMRVPKGAYWDSLLFLRKRELFEVCKDNRLFVLALKDPSVLYQNQQEECLVEIDALNGDSTDLINAWIDLKERQKLNNCCPDNVERIFKNRYNSSDRLKYARLQLMIYGWGNCANQFIYYYTDYRRVEQEFQKLFLSVEREDYQE